jgi:tRNA G10  N-methylase Trm11
MKKHYKSVFDNEQELLKALIDVHLDGKDIELDPMYFKGNFYKDGVNPPKYKFDINPQIDGVEKADAGFLPLPIEFEGIRSVILDPPFLFGIHGKTKEYYSSKTHGIMSWNDLEQLYFNIIKEALRYLKYNGIMIFKCQDYTDAKTTMTHCVVKDIAERWGFYAKDIAILVKPNKITNPNTKQRHLRKIHTYFWVFQKRVKTSKVKEMLEIY